MIVDSNVQLPIPDIRSMGFHLALGTKAEPWPPLAILLMENNIITSIKISTQNITAWECTVESKVLWMCLRAHWQWYCYHYQISNTPATCMPFRSKERGACLSDAPSALISVNTWIWSGIYVGGYGMYEYDQLMTSFSLLPSPPTWISGHIFSLEEADCDPRYVVIFMKKLVAKKTW